MNLRLTFNAIKAATVLKVMGVYRRLYNLKTAA